MESRLPLGDVVFTTGQVLQDRYELRQRLGAGANRNPRQTWLARDLRSSDAEALVVLKFLRFSGSQWTELKLFEREVQILRQLHHPRIPRCGAAFHLQEPEEWMGFVETYIPGQSLQALLDQGRRFSEVAVRSIAEQVLEILIYLHGCSPPVLHRDIKPSNLILTSDRQVFLIDFGAVQDRPRPAGQSFTVVGTYGYTPMEQFGGQTEPASDLFALGVTLIHLLTGLPPSELVQADLTIPSECIQAPPQFADWLMQMTAPALAHRFTSAQQALTALKAPPTPSIVEPPQSRILLKPSSDCLSVSIPPLITLKTMAWLELFLFGVLMGGVIVVLIPVGVQMLLHAFRSFDFAGMGAGLLLSALGGIACTLIWNLLKRFFGSTQLTFTLDSVTMQRTLWGIKYRQRHCCLDPVSKLEILPFGPADTTVVVGSSQTSGEADTSVSAAGDTLTLVEKLSPAEGQWLVQEVQDWLRTHRDDALTEKQ